MAGELETGRRLRRRSSTAATVSTTTDADAMRRTRAAAKRSAMEETSSRSTVLHPKKRAVQPVRKRTALANVTNQVNPPANTRLVALSESKSIILKPILAFEGDENQSFENPGLCGDDVKEEESGLESQEQEPEPVLRSSSAVIASLERRTVQKLCISNEAKDRVKQGGLFNDSPSDKLGWSSNLNFQDIDNDHSDPQMCSMYATDIYVHLRMAEIKRRPTTNFMEVMQQDINPSMRGILIDWLVEVAEEYKLVPDTLYLTVSYIDRFLSCNVVTRQRLQLLGVSCMLIAAKYEEICAPQVEEFCYITDNTYGREEVLEMERRVLNELKFELTTPTTKSFLRRFVRAAQASYKVPTLNLEFLGNFLAELTLLEYGFLPFLPSMIAASAVYMAKLTLDSSTCPWDHTLQHYTGYKPSELEKCVRAIHELQRNTKNCTLPAIREKYRQHKFKCVSSMGPPALLPPEYFKDLE